MDVTMRWGSKNDAESRGQKRFSSHGDPFREHFCVFENLSFSADAARRNRQGGGGGGALRMASRRQVSDILFRS